MIQDIKDAAEKVGITAVITNSDSKIETQLNRITDHAYLPIMLISWDLNTSLEFDSNGFLKNPTTPVTCLLMTKSDTVKKEQMEKAAEEMGILFTKFIQTLYGDLIKYNRDTTSSVITGAGYTLVPKHGAGKHSGIIGRFTMKGSLDNC